VAAEPIDLALLMRGLVAHGLVPSLPRWLAAAIVQFLDSRFELLTGPHRSVAIAR